MRKLSAHYIFPVNQQPIKYGILVLDDNGRVTELVETGGNLKEEGDLEFYPGILVPGFVNAHCHLELSHLLNRFPQNTGMSGFLDRVTLERKADPEIVRKAIRFAAAGMYRYGTSVVGDIVNTDDTISEKLVSPVYWHSIIELFGLRSNDADQIWKAGMELMKKFEENNLPVSMSPHTPYTVSRVLWRYFHSSDPGLLSIHSQESMEEEEFMTQRTGKMAEWFNKRGSDFSELPPPGQSSLRSVLEFLPEISKLLLVHNTHTKAEDIKALLSRYKNDQVFWVLCPNSNLFIENRLPEDLILNRKGLNLCLGTDSLASNTSLSLLEEMKTIQKYFPGIELDEIVSWSTMNGARAFGVEEKYGSFEIGKSPGVVWISGISYPDLKLTDSSRSTRLL